MAYGDIIRNRKQSLKIEADVDVIDSLRRLKGVNKL